MHLSVFQNMHGKTKRSKEEGKNSAIESFVALMFWHCVQVPLNGQPTDRHIKLTCTYLLDIVLNP